MTSRLLVALVSGLLLLTGIVVAQNARPNPTQNRIEREVGHELLMLPNYGAFDNIAYKLEGGTLTLLGDVEQPSLRTEAENAVKHVEGVNRVVDQIDVLPPSSQDDALRMALFRAIYQYPSLQKYEIGALKPIRIIVKNARVTLEGVVDSEPDRELVGARAQSVPGVFQVTNHLRVQEPSLPEPG